MRAHARSMNEVLACGVLELGWSKRKRNSFKDTQQSNGGIPHDGLVPFICAIPIHQYCAIASEHLRVSMMRTCKNEWIRSPSQWSEYLRKACSGKWLVAGEEELRERHISTDFDPTQPQQPQIDRIWWSHTITRLRTLCQRQYVYRAQHTTHYRLHTTQT